jgi:hypothetical protein
MTNLSITAGNVDWQSGARPFDGYGGAAITRGQVLYLNSSLRYVLADASAANTAAVAGIAITDGTNGGIMKIAGPGSRINIGATTVAGLPYVLSATAGAICPYADLLATEIPNLLFWGTGTATVTLVLSLSPVAIPA